MKKLVTLLVVLALCMPTYGYILVYKVTMSGTNAEFETDDISGWLLKSGSGSGYLVLDVNDTDANSLNDVRFIDYYTDKTDHTTSKVYETWNAGENFKQTILPGRPPRGKDITNMELDLSSGSITLTGRALGTVSSTDIGTLDEVGGKTKVAVATSLKSSFLYDTPDEIGCGTLSVTLDSKWTKTANNPDETKGFGGMLDWFLDPTSGPSEDDLHAPRGLINWLESKGGGGYKPSTE